MTREISNNEPVLTNAYSVKKENCLSKVQLPTREEIEQALIARHGEEIHTRFQNAKAAICGLGGLGSNIAMALARAGIGRLHLIDFDEVDLSNIHRQQYLLEQIGMKKTDAMKELIQKVAPYTEVITDTVKITEDNYVNLLAGDDLICEAFDNPEAKAMLVNGVLEAFPDKYVVAASGMAGLSSANAIKTRKITRHFYICGDGTSDICDGLGLVASRVMLCGAHQAHMVLRILAGEEQP